MSPRSYAGYEPNLFKAHNLTFASVHDSYWTHASTIDNMSVIIRDTFIALHGSNVLQRLYDEVRTNFKSA